MVCRTDDRGPSQWSCCVRGFLGEGALKPAAVKQAAVPEVGAPRGSGGCPVPPHFLWNVLAAQACRWPSKILSPPLPSVCPSVAYQFCFSREY